MFRRPTRTCHSPGTDETGSTERHAACGFSFSRLNAACMEMNSVRVSTLQAAGPAFPSADQISRRISTWPHRGRSGRKQHHSPVIRIRP